MVTNRTTNTELGERMAEIEGQLSHMATKEQIAVIQGQLSHMATKEHVAKLTEQISQLRERMPELSRNTGRADKHDGWDQAKEDSQKDGFAKIAIIISTFMAVVTTAAFLWSVS